MYYFNNNNNNDDDDDDDDNNDNNSNNNVERIKFKILLLTWKIVHGFAPHYFDDMILKYVPSRNLRSTGTGMLTPRRVKCLFGEKAFATSAPVLWNALPSNVRNAESLESFKSGLKTNLFSSYFD